MNFDLHVNLTVVETSALNIFISLSDKRKITFLSCYGTNTLRSLQNTSALIIFLQLSYQIKWYLPLEICIYLATPTTSVTE